MSSVDIFGALETKIELAMRHTLSLVYLVERFLRLLWSSLLFVWSCGLLLLSSCGCLSHPSTHEQTTSSVDRIAVCMSHFSTR